MKKVCVVTGTRAEYGLLRWVMEGIRESRVLELQLVATGMHLSPEFGMTVNVIEADGFKIDRKVEMLLSSDTPVGVTKSMGLGMIGFADALAELQPDLMLVLGDRYEIFAAASAAMIARIPIAHLHGGELTEGAIDDAIRHSITKMSYLHFVAAEEYRRRVIQLGEEPVRVFNVGGLGIDGISRQQFLSRKEVESAIGLKLGARSLLITFHPVTSERGGSICYLDNLLKSISKLKETSIIFTAPGADIENRAIRKKIEQFCYEKSHAKFYVSMGQLLYLSCMKYVGGVLGNSSSGVIEAPFMKKGSINIGSRQKGRLLASSVIQAEPTVESIDEALSMLYSEEFQNKLNNIKSLYGDAGASKKIISTIEKETLIGYQDKSFYNMD